MHMEEDNSGGNYFKGDNQTDSV